MKRIISERDAKKVVKKPNPRRQWGNSEGDSIDKFRVCCGDIIELFAIYLEKTMKKEPNTGEGCRVQYNHVEMQFGRFYRHMSDFVFRTEHKEEEE